MKGEPRAESLGGGCVCAQALRVPLLSLNFGSGSHLGDDFVAHCPHQPHPVPSSQLPARAGGSLGTPGPAASDFFTVSFLPSLPVAGLGSWWPEHRLPSQQVKLTGWSLQLCLDRANGFAPSSL